MERAYTNSLTTHMKTLEQKEANTPKRSRRQKIIILKAEINQIETKRNIQRIYKTKSWFFEKINKIDKTLARLKEGSETLPKLIKSEMKWKTSKQKLWEFKKIIRSYFKSQYSTKFKNQDEMEIFLDTY